MLAHAARDSRAPCLDAPGHATLTSGALAGRIAHVRDRFAAWGLERGDIVVAALEDRPLAAALFTAASARSTFALLSPSLGEEACGELLGRMRARAAIVPQGRSTALERAAAARRIARIAIASTGDEAGGFALSLLDAGRAPFDPGSRHDPGWAHIGITSGTTARPKIVPYTHASVVRMSDAIGAMLGIGAADTAALVTPLHLANAQRTSLLASFVNGASVLCLADGDVDALLEAMRADRVSTFSASFTIMRALLDRLGPGGRVRSSRLRYVRIASGALEPGEIRSLERALGVPALAALATTESGILTHQRLPPAPRTPGGVGSPVIGEVRLVDGEGRLAAPGEVGEVEARGPQVFGGYLDDDRLNAQLRVDGWFRTGDLGRLGTGGELFLVGRAAEVINRGGDKIAPLEVDAALRAIEGVADAAAFGVPHPTLGEEIVAAVVRAPGSALHEGDIVAATGERLGARRAPRRVWFVDALPRNAAGKLMRSQLPGIVGYVAPTATTDADGAEGSALESALAGLWCGVLGVGSVRPDARFRALGGDDALAARLVGEVAAVFGVGFAAQALDGDVSTVAAMAARIEDARRR